MIKKTKAQAITEFVLILPVILLLFIGVYQFGLIMFAKIKLAMIEREVMRFITDEEDRKGNIKKFTEDIAEKSGLNKANLQILNNERKYNSNEGFSLSKSGPLSSFAGVEFILTYEQNFLPLFATITGKKSIRIQTKLVTASGGNFVFKIKDSIMKAGEKIKKIIFPNNEIDKEITAEDIKCEK